jgi:hypothetical protein
MQRLEWQRGKGRDDYPVRPSWNALVAERHGPASRHRGLHLDRGSTCDKRPQQFGPSRGDRRAASGQSMRRQTVQHPGEVMAVRLVEEALLKLSKHGAKSLTRDGLVGNLPRDHCRGSPHLELVR